MDQSNNVIRFPVENRRFDLSNIQVDPESIAKEIRMIKLDYFAVVADQMLDDTLRSMTILNLESGKIPTKPIEQKDLILMKESIVSGLCRIVGIEHPLHKFIEENITVTHEPDDDDPTIAYKFKDSDFDNFG